MELIQPEFRYKQDKAMNLNKLDRFTKQQVLRLLDRKGYDLKAQTKAENKKYIIYIDPESIALLVWNLVFLTAFYVIQLQISLLIAFGPHFTQKQLGTTYRPVYITLLLILIMDLLLSFFKGFHAFGKGKIVDDGRLVAYRYVSTQFFFDLTVILFYIIPLIHESQALNYLQLIPLVLIWIKKSKGQEQMEYILQYRKLLRSALVLLILLSDALIFGSYGACIFILMDIQLYKSQVYGPSSSANPSQYYWLSTNTDYSGYLLDGPWLAQYIYAQFFSTGTLSTLAPGPFPRNPIEVGYSIFLMIFFMIYASYLADVLVQVVYTYSQARMIHEENILSFDNFMRLKDVQERTRLRIFNYFELKWQLEFKSQSNQQKTMIEKLPLHLKQQLLQEIGFTNELFFLNNLPKTQQLKKLISLKIERSTVDANTCIFQSHQLLNHRKRCLFYIKQGTAKFYLDRSRFSKDLQKKKETILNLTDFDRTLGVYQFLTGQDFAICCKSIDLCLIQSLQWTAFMEVITQLGIQEFYFELRDRALVDRQLSLIYKVCLVCEKSHLEIECPRIFISNQIQEQLKVQRKKQYNDRRKLRQKRRKNIISKKRLPELKTQDSQASNIFDVFKNINLGGALTQMIVTEKTKEVAIDQVESFRKYFPQYNMFVRSKTIQQSTL